MEAFVTALRQLMLTVLFASFVHLLLPQTALRRYVRLVLALVIVSIVLTPIVQAFHREDSTALHALQQEVTAAITTHVPTEAPPQLQQTGDAMKQHLARRAREQATQQLEQAIVSQLRTQWHFLEATAEVSLPSSPNAGDSLDVRLDLGTQPPTEEAPSHTETDMSSSFVFEPLEIAPIGMDTAQPSSHEVSQQTVIPLAAWTAVHHRIAQWLLQTWGIVPTAVSFVQREGR